ncbi:VOC family protein [Cryptosporangium japonicum]|uniref:VOC domain-containing protein n=1 Tax=Cryptosporangium japonicum TaxID=80872 RepID=A0ABN0V8P8_9ACTN
MTDPLDALRDPGTPQRPDPEFAAALRRRLGEALAGPIPRRSEEDLMTLPITIKQFSPYLAVVDARRAIDFYVAAFGAEVVDQPTIMPDGKIGHVTLQIGPLRLFFAEEFPEMGLQAPPSLGGVSVTLHLSLASADEVDAVAQRAVAAGATLERPVTDGPYGRAGVIVDPSGHRWFLLFEPH